MKAGLPAKLVLGDSLPDDDDGGGVLPHPSEVEKRGMVSPPETGATAQPITDMSTNSMASRLHPPCNRPATVNPTTELEEFDWKDIQI